MPVIRIECPDDLPGLSGQTDTNLGRPTLVFDEQPDLEAEARRGR